MSDDNFIPTDLHTRASLDLQQEVEDELAKPDPSPEAASAAIREAIKNHDQDEPEGEG